MWLVSIYRSRQPKDNQKERDISPKMYDQVLLSIVHLYFSILVSTLCHELGHLITSYLLGYRGKMSLICNRVGLIVGGHVSFEETASFAQYYRHYGEYTYYVYAAQQIAISLMGPLAGLVSLTLYYDYIPVGITCPLLLQMQRSLLIYLAIHQVYNLLPIIVEDPDLGLLTSDGYDILWWFMSQSSLDRACKLSTSLIGINEVGYVIWFAYVNLSALLSHV